MSTDRFVRQADIARLLGVSPARVRQLRQRADFPLPKAGTGRSLFWRLGGHRALGARARAELMERFANIIAKADRLIADDRLYELPAVRAYTVVGDTGTYITMVAQGGEIRTCTCPAREDCSHIAAALRLELEKQVDPLAAMERRVEAMEREVAACEGTGRLDFESERPHA